MCSGPEREGLETGLLEEVSPGGGTPQGGGTGSAHPDCLGCEDDEPVDGPLFGSIGLLGHSSEAQWCAFNQVKMKRGKRRMMGFESVEYIT